MDTDDEDELNELIDAYLLNQEINQALNGDNQHETLPDKSDADIDTVASVIMTLALVGCAAIAVIVLYLLYRLMKFIRKKYNEKPSQNIIISEDERMKRRMKAMQRFEAGSSCHDGEYHQLIPSHQTRDSSKLRQRTTTQPTQTHQQTKNNNKLDRLIHNEEMFKREDGITSKGRGDTVVETAVPNESRARTQQAIANIMKKKDPITAMIGKRATHFERSQQQQQQQQQMDDKSDEDEEVDLGLFSGDYGSSGSTPQAPRRRYEEVRNDRTDAIEAAIIRVMRERRTQTHNQLEQYVQSRVRRINPQPREVMRVIETLICRGYLERNAGASQHLDLSEYRWITLS